MSEYIISSVSPDDSRATKQINSLLESEGIRRDTNLDYTCGMYDDEMNIIATGSCFGNTLRCMAVSSLPRSYLKYAKTHVKIRTTYRHLTIWI